MRGGAQTHKRSAPLPCFSLRSRRFASPVMYSHSLERPHAPHQQHNTLQSESRTPRLHHQARQRKRHRRQRTHQLLISPPVGGVNKPARRRRASHASQAREECGEKNEHPRLHTAKGHSFTRQQRNRDHTREHRNHNIRAATTPPDALYGP